MCVFAQFELYLLSVFTEFCAVVTVVHDRVYASCFSISLCVCVCAGILAQAPLPSLLISHRLYLLLVRVSARAAVSRKVPYHLGNGSHYY